MPAVKTADKFGPHTAGRAIQWAAPVLWIGAAIYFSFSPALALIGVGVIILLVQLAKKLAGLNFSRIWNAVAAMFLGVGILVLLADRVEIFWSAMLFGMFGLVILLAGAAVVCSVIGSVLQWIRRRRDEDDTPEPPGPKPH